MILLITTILLTALYSVVESLHDVNVIRNDKGWSEYASRWHVYGAITNGVALFVPFAVLSLISGVYIASLMLILAVILFWQLHDSIIGYLLYKKIFYLGKNGLDGWLNRVFHGGANLSVVRLGVIGCVIIEYFRSI